MGRYSNIDKRKLTTNDIRDRGVSYYSKTVKYPEIEANSDDIYIVTTVGDDLPALANQFYNDKDLYWIIAAANPNDVDFGSIFITPGTQLRLPVNISSIIESFNQLNNQ